MAVMSSMRLFLKFLLASFFVTLMLLVHYHQVITSSRGHTEFRETKIREQLLTNGTNVMDFADALKEYKKMLQNGGPEKNHHPAAAGLNITNTADVDFVKIVQLFKIKTTKEELDKLYQIETKSNLDLKEGEMLPEEHQVEPKNEVEKNINMDLLPVDGLQQLQKSQELKAILEITKVVEPPLMDKLEKVIKPEISNTLFDTPKRNYRGQCKFSKARYQKRVFKSKFSKASSRKRVLKSELSKASYQKRVLQSEFSKASSRKRVLEREFVFCLF
jgi:hypothetical protein